MHGGGEGSRGVDKDRWDPDPVVDLATRPFHTPSSTLDFLTLTLCRPVVAAVGHQLAVVHL